MRNTLLALIVIASFAVPAGAAEPFIALVDLDRELLLIPEGTAVPRGVEFYLEPADERPDGFAGRVQETGAEEVVATAEAAPRKRLVYAYAPVERFAAARKSVQEDLSRELQVFVADMDEYYYFYFADGSYHRVRKYIKNYPDLPAFSNVQFGFDTVGFTAGGDLDSKISLSHSSTALSNWNETKTCWFYGTEGTCKILMIAYQTNANFTATATSKASIVQYLYPPCDLPCKKNYYSSVVINFP
jgi:hypothetical protein